MTKSHSPLSQAADDMKTAATKQNFAPGQDVRAMVKGGSTTRINLTLMRTLTNASEAVSDKDPNFRKATATNIETALTNRDIEYIVNPADHSPAVNAGIQELTSSKRTADLGSAYEQRWAVLKNDVTQREKELLALRETAKKTIDEQQQKLKEIVRGIEAKKPEGEIIKDLDYIEKAKVQLIAQTEKQAINNSSLNFKVESMLHEMGHAPEARAPEVRTPRRKTERPS